MNISKNSLNALMGIIIILMSFSCIKDSFDFDKMTNEVHWQPSLAAPIAYGNLTMIDGIKTYDSANHVVINEDGYLSIVFYEKVESDTVSEIMKIDNQQLSQTIPSSGIDFTGFNTSGQTMTVDYNYDLHFDMFNPDAEIDSIWFDEGHIDLAAISTFDHSMEVTITMPTVTKNGQPFSETMSLQPYGDSKQNLNNMLNGYHADLTQTPQGYNEIPVHVSLDITHSGGSNTGDLDLQVDVINPDHEAMFGYFGHNTLIFESGKIQIDLFNMDDNWSLEDFTFKDPKIKTNYENSYGIPTNFYFDSLRAHSQYNNQTTNVLTYSGGLPMDSTNPYNVAYTTAFGQTIKDSIMVDKTNSNVKDIIDNRPAWFKFIAHAHTNPGGAADHSNFVWDDSKFMANVKVELPLWGYIDRFHGLDTADFDLDKEFEDPGMIDRLMVRLNIDNGLPAEASSQAYLVDSNYVVLDSVLTKKDTRVVQAASVDSDGKVISKASQTTDVTMTDERLDKIMDTKYIIYKASASTTNAIDDKLVKIYEDYEVSFNVAVEADLNVEVDLDTIN